MYTTEQELPNNIGPGCGDLEAGKNFPETLGLSGAENQGERKTRTDRQILQR